MKKKILISIILIFVIFPVLTTGQVVLDLPKPGLTPNSSFYFIDTFFEKVSLFFTFSSNKKAEKALIFAEEKLAEVKIMIEVEKDKNKAIEKATQKYQEFLDIVNQKSQEAKDREKDVEEFLVMATEVVAKHQIVLENLLEKIPEQARSVIQTTIEKNKISQQQALQSISKEKKIEVLNKIVQIKIEAKQDQEIQEAKMELEEADKESQKVEAEIQELNKKVEETKDESEKARLMAEIQKAKAETERLKKEVEEAKTKTLKTEEQEQIEEQKIYNPTIASIVPNQILDNVKNQLTITGTDFQSGAKVIIGGINIESTVVNNQTITIEILSGQIAPNTYSIQVINSDNTTASLYNALTIIKPAIQTSPTLSELTKEEIAAKVSPAIVQILNDVEMGYGSGMIIDTAGYILTNEHVIEGDSIVDVYLEDGRIFEGSVIGWNENVDLAIVKINGSNFDYVTFGNSNTVNQGEDVFVFGHPEGFPAVSMEPGIITAKYSQEGISYLQTNALTRPGSSGAPWVDSDAQVIGVHQLGLKYPGTDISVGMNFAIPINVAKSVLPDLKSGVKVSNPKLPKPDEPEPVLEPEPEPTPEPEPEPEPIDIIPPIISNIEVSDIGSDSIMITWGTDEKSDSEVKFGLTQNYTDMLSDNANSLNHSIKIDNLDTNTTYHFQISSTDNHGNTVISEDKTFITKISEWAVGLVGPYANYRPGYTPRKVWNGSEFGVVWSYPRDGAGADVYFVKEDQDGNKLTDDIKVTDNADFDSLYPEIAWNGSEFGVVWTDSRKGHYEIYFSSVSSDGEKLTNDIKITDGVTQSGCPEIVWTGSKYGIVYFNGDSGVNEIYLALVGRNGDIEKKTQVSHHLSAHSEHPSLVWGGSNFGIAWHDAGVYFAKFNIDGVKNGNEVKITDAGAYVSITFDESLYAVVWNSGDGNTYSASGR